ncbi:imidazolonepropionase-like amidohydrolase [Tenacibaculum adriaticum]|uniref:Imidazolonepropionase-like amidohydrolase n=1 Tax=Tenacibaculum adriaticum TaxID=413713 RepID=A0A5S5DTD4_9FLAO|nr:amidohydrolase family protein [Tenacibaculum adriaticum]TYP99203.1 imidazolonepropionase-like amidohydrolase [Tenacibaculum adriaticum]
MKKILILLFFSVSVIYSQEYFPTNTGVKTSKNTSVAFTNATIYVTATNIIKKGTLLIKDGKVVSIGKRISIPNDAEVVDLKDKTIYPSFIDIYNSFGIQSPKREQNSSRRPQYDASRKGYYWNDHIRPDVNAATEFSFDNKKAKELLEAGFGVVNTHVEDGIMQGNGILVALNPNSSDGYRILDKKSGNYLSFNKSKKSNQSYPTSRMGAMALLRQTYMDADWYANGNAKNTDLALEALNKNKTLPQIFNTGNYLDALRADKVGDEFGIQYTILGGGNEYERIEEIKNTNAKFILPVNFRKAYDVSDQFLADKISLHDMRQWNQEPSNPSILAKNGITFAFTTRDLKSTKDFNKNIQKAIKHGLDKTKALEALTTIPAQIIGKSNVGNLNVGSYANFLITSGDIFDSKTTIYENWTQGDQNVINSKDIKDLTGDYMVAVNGKTYDLTISGKGDKQKGSVKFGEKKLKSDFSFKDDWVQLTINDNDQFLRLAGKIINASNAMQGAGKDNLGNDISWSASKKVKKSDDKKKDDKKSNDKKLVIQPVSYPNIGYGNYTKPQKQTILIKNATVWTSENNQVLKNTDVLLKDGKISQIGKNLSTRGATVIDGTDKYLTAGIIDEHSHIATSAVNEAGHNSTAEVTIEDVVNPDDINIYRNLAGGVTSIQILHGSANPIGGRSAIIKLKWGENADNLIYKNSPKFIKFALGENVKQSNWGDSNTIRFPQTRMGVEQVYTDYFQRAKEYDALKKSGKSYRKDLELEALAEIINKERFISCHSYVQSEINMLMKVAEKFNFNINTFTHILEGYKVADKMKQHGVGGSTFSDWWAYKYEVNDAIPYNAAIMHNQGITVAINSDDAEMSRRLNQEAAKTMKYGDLTEQEAWRMVTINPAKLLHIDDRTGSIKTGKDADIVVWSGNPLSIYSKAEKTIIDGAIYFDIEKERQKRKEIKAERAKLIEMMLQEKLGGAETQAPTKKEHKLFHCDTE